MKITILLPYEGAEQQAAIWAEEEAGIDFRADPLRAARCTLSFAAMELKRYLARTLPAAEISISAARPADGQFLQLTVADPAGQGERFRLEPQGEGVVIAGDGRTGALYGAYELLRLQGWRWYAPGKAGEVAPPAADALRLPETPREYGPSMDLGRGFDFEGVSKESAELLLWMARNRLNLSGYRPATGPLGHKLGMSPKVGGHIFHEILDPDRVLPSGKTLWEEHPDWYGLPAGRPRSRESALSTQFCTSQPDLREFLAEALLGQLMGEWREAERVDIWGFDTWGSTCACPDCVALGNSADQALFFLASLRDSVDRARAAGRLDHDVRLVACAYEGTATLRGPERPIPANLLAAGDYVVFYPINRCYSHDFTLDSCGENAPYHAALASWCNASPALPVMVGEYYNVSKFEDLPLLFTQRIRDDLPAYHALGVRGMTYMHVPLVNWAMRTLTQSLYAQMAWDTHTDVEQFVLEYFVDWYGPHAAEMREVYSLIEEAWRACADWRAWARQSVLSRLQAWDGARPAAPLAMENHFGTPAGAVESGRRSVALLQRAETMLNVARARAERAGADATLHAGEAAVNPIQARERETVNQVEMRLGEDRRLLSYGIEVMTLMAEFVAYHEALRLGETEEAVLAWRRIEAAADSLDSRYIPIGFEQPGAGLESKDALTRSQLRDLLRRCRAHAGTMG